MSAYSMLSNLSTAKLVFCIKNHVIYTFMDPPQFDGFACLVPGSFHEHLNLPRIHHDILTLSYKFFYLVLVKP